MIKLLTAVALVVFALNSQAATLECSDGSTVTGPTPACPANQYDILNLQVKPESGKSGVTYFVPESVNYFSRTTSDEVDAERNVRIIGYVITRRVLLDDDSDEYYVEDDIKRVWFDRNGVFQKYDGYWYKTRDHLSDNAIEQGIGEELLHPVLDVIEGDTTVRGVKGQYIAKKFGSVLADNNKALYVRISSNGDAFTSGHKVTPQNKAKVTLGASQIDLNQDDVSLGYPIAYSTAIEFFLEVANVISADNGELAKALIGAQYFLENPNDPFAPAYLNTDYYTGATWKPFAPNY